MGWTGFRYAGVLGFGFLALYPLGGVQAQIPVAIPNEPAEINACVCMQLASGTLAADKDAKSQALAAANQQLADLNAQLASARSGIDVNNPDAVARYKALLERRDAAFGQIGPAQSAAAGRSHRRAPNRRPTDAHNPVAPWHPSCSPRRPRRQRHRL